MFLSNFYAVQVFSLTLAITFTASLSANDVTVRIDRTGSAKESRLELGITHTHVGTDHEDAYPRPAQRSKLLIREAAYYQNTHIIGWGPHNIMPRPGEYDWSTLDDRMAMMNDIGIEPVITLCTAPGWMKRETATWEMEDRPKEQYFDDFADLALEVAKRYPHVQYFQIWNELKGFWSDDVKHWDHELFTKFYNTIYDRLKDHNPQLNIGGPYIVLEGTGSQDILGKTGNSTETPLTVPDQQFIQYWLDNKAGADFITVDRHIASPHDPTEYDIDQRLALTPVHRIVHDDLREMTDLPIWWSEFYGPPDDATEQQIATVFASLYYHKIHGGAAVSLLWNPNEGETPTYLFSDVRKSDGGRPVAHYAVFRAINKYFSKGASIYATESSDRMVEVLASSTKIMVINKDSQSHTITVQDSSMPDEEHVFVLSPYEVILATIDNPTGAKTLAEYKD